MTLRTSILAGPRIFQVALACALVLGIALCGSDLLLGLVVPDPARFSPFRDGLLLGLSLAALAVIATFLPGAVRPKEAPEAPPDEHAPESAVFRREHLEYLSVYSNDAALLLDDEGEILDANPRAIQMYGWSRSELIGRNIRTLMHADMLPLMEKRWLEDRTRQGTLFESFHVTQDGSTFPVEVSSHCFSVGERVLRQVFIRDITERKQAERTLLETLDQFRLLVDSVDGIVWESDPRSLYVTFVSRRAEYLLGYPTAQWLTEPGFWRHHLHPEDREQTIACFEEAEKRLEPFAAEYRMIASDGRPVWIRDIVMVTAEEGRAVRLHGVMVDISERKQVEAELERARDYYFTLLDKLPDPVWQTDPAGRFVYVNKAWLDFTDQEPGRALEGHWIDLCPPEERAEIRQRYQAAHEHRQSFSFEHRLRCQDGSYHEVQNHGRPLVFKDRFEGYVGIFHDLHDLRQAQSDTHRIKDLYHALIQTGQLIIHAPDRKSLFRDICAIATHQARFTMAWVGLADPATRQVHVEAVEGPAQRFPQGLQVSCHGDDDLGRGPTGTCIREGRYQVVNDILTAETMTPWLGLAEEYGVRAAASFPLRLEGHVIGALTLYSQEAGCFDPDRVALLNEMAQDISFALDRLEADSRRQQMEQALRESEANLAKAQELALMGSWEWDVARNQGRWSTGMETIYGFPFQEGPGHLERVMTSIHPEDRVRYQSRLLKLITSGGTMDSDYRILRPDGEERAFQVHAVAELDASGHTTLIRGITQDVTERKRSEERVRETLRRLEDLKAAVDESAVVLITDAAGVITYANQRLCEITGYASEELVGLTPRIFSSNHHPEAFWQEMWEIISAGGIWRGEVKNRAKDGSFHWLDTTIVPFLDEGGNPGQYMAIRFDITALKLAEERVLAISADRMALLEASAVAKVVPWSLDLSTGHLRMGDSALLVLGKPAMAFQAHPNALRELLKSEDQKLLIHAQAEARAGMIGSFEAPVRRGERQIIWTRWTIARREGSLHGVVQDITEQHELHSQLLQSQKLESLGTLVGGITHDFNNILMGILGYAEVLSSMPDLPAGVQKGIGVIGRAAERGRGLVNQLLRFSRRTVATKVMHNLNDIVKEIQGLMQLPGDSLIQLEVFLDPNLPDTLMDPGQLNQVVMNLAVNARDAIAGRGLIRFQTGLIELGPQAAAELERPPGPYLFLEVEDTGSGIRPEVLSRIFEPFFTTKGTGKGTGLGLSVAHGIVEAHRGHIQCRSELGKGTCFRILLPCITDERLMRESDNTTPTLPAHRILLLDDPGHGRSTAADLLVYMGNLVIADADVTRAIEAHREEAFHLAIVNLAMANQTGLEILKRLQEALPDVPVIAGTGQEEPALTHLRRQPHAIIQWPFRAVELLSAIQRVLGG